MQEQQQAKGGNVIQVIQYILTQMFQSLTSSNLIQDEKLNEQTVMQFKELLL